MFSIAKRKQIVGLAVSPSLGLEACVYDQSSRKVIKYGQKSLSYNIASKEIQDFSAFKSAIYDLFAELEIEKDRNVCYCVLPNVYFGFQSFEEDIIDKEEIEGMLLSQVSQSYIFKQEEPVLAWANVNESSPAASKYIAYSAVQKRVVETIQDVMMDEEVELLGIETATTAIPRGVFLTGACNDVIADESNWNILVINPNGYTISQMSGTKLLDYVETPFAIMSFDGDDIYPALASAIGQYLPNYPAKKLVIVSMTDNVSSERLRDEIVFEEDIITFDSNRYSETSIISLSSSVIEKTAFSTMSLTALGAAFPKNKGFATLNFLGDVSLDGLIEYGTVEFAGDTVLVNSETVPKFMIILATIILSIGLLFSGLLLSLSFVVDKQKNSVSDKIQQTNTEIKILESKLRDIVSNLIMQIMENNKTAMNYYDSLASDIPSDVWLTYYTNTDGKNVAIEGYSTNIEDIYKYYKSLKMLVPSSGIKLNKLEVLNKEEKDKEKSQDSLVLKKEPEGPRTFYFEVSNSSYTKGFDENGNPVEPAAQAAPAANNAQPKTPAEGEEGANPEMPEMPDGMQPYKKEPSKGIPNVPDIEVNLKEIK